MIRTALAAIALATIAVAPSSSAMTDTSRRDITPPCAYEDGSGQGGRCVWDARHMGNGAGQSLLIINGGDDDARYIHITHRRAHRLMTTNR